MFNKYSCDTFDGFQDILRKFWVAEIYRNDDAKEWNKFEDLDAKSCRIITTLIKKTDTETLAGIEI